MRLLNLSLENWRGIEARQLHLSGGVTLIEGPNEIGKSTIVEAVRMLFSEMDSSKKKGVKAIQPVGQDVGSSVQAEIEAGDYHFIYAKTFNRAPQTSLDILAPGKRQLTGREAHEEVGRILGETVDLALWDALLVEQGEKVAPANLQASAGLARALDEAAGTASAGAEDLGLYQAVQAEFEKYFTLKTGRQKFSELEEAYRKAQISLDASRQALEVIEQDSRDHDRCSGEVLRLRTQLPGLRETMLQHEAHWTTVKSLKERVAAKESELGSARALQNAANNAHRDREELIRNIALNETDLKTAKGGIKPLETRVGGFREEAEKSQLAIAGLRKDVKALKTALNLAQTDEKQLRNLAALAGERDRLGQLDRLSITLKAELETTGSIRIDDAKLQDLRTAERRLEVAGGKRDSAATVVSVKAERKLELEIGDDMVALDESGMETRSVASEMQIRLPGVASIRLVPPQPVAELQEEVNDAINAFAALKSQLGVEDLQGAEVLNERRKAARREVERLKERERSILNGASREEIEQSLVSRQAEHDGYIRQRGPTPALPGNVAEAARQVETAVKKLEAHENDLEAMRTELESIQAGYVQVDEQLRAAQQDLAGIEAALAEKRQRLEKARSVETDDTLAKRAAATNAALSELERETKDLTAILAKSSPDAVEALFTNARNVFERANSDLVREEQSLAVLADRLQQAQADGRYETMEAAEREFQARETSLGATRRRATAIELLWHTLNKHRNAARQAYVRPLKEAVERLGAIVFGSGFEVELGDDWSLLSRTLHGKTLPFDDLSVGAKEQLGILTRLAAGQIVSKQGGVPLIIDDALGFSDPTRLETMGAAIAAAGKQCQIIILTCTPGRFTHVGSAEVVRF